MIDCTNYCDICMKDAPHPYCCKKECGEHEFCRGCNHSEEDDGDPDAAMRILGDTL